jgi:hypothetical protein
MQVRVIKFFGREVLRIENHYEATVSDVIKAMIEAREATEEIQYVCECSCGDEEDDDEEESDEEGIRGRFSDMTDRIVWDARTDDYPLPFSNPDNEEDEPKP